MLLEIKFARGSVAALGAAVRPNVQVGHDVSHHIAAVGKGVSAVSKRAFVCASRQHLNVIEERIRVSVRAVAFKSGRSFKTSFLEIYLN